MRGFVRGFVWLLVLAVVVGVGFGIWARGRLRASLPRLDGTSRLTGLAATVTVTRDALGIPTIRGASREDVARATGFLHAQDRFFQMDLSRRRAAGELAGLVGARALPLDRATRIHRFRAQATRAVTLLEAKDRRILDAYVAGANSGLASLGAAPFEYLLLGQTPQPWRAEDSLLVVLSMFLTLQDSDGSYEAMSATMRDILPAEVTDFLSPRGTEWDSPIQGDSFAVPPVPSAGTYNLRARRMGKASAAPPRRQEVAETEPFGVGPGSGEAALGSNNWAVNASLSADGGALVANDMHLDVRVPNTWYRAAMAWTDTSTSEAHTLAGITLPGLPALVVGSNTFVAWGFTNTYADWSDIVLLEVDATDAGRYRTPAGWRQFDRYEEAIEVAGEPPAREPVAWTVWGPVIRPDHKGRPRALRWVAHSAERLSKSVTPLESARTVEDAFEAANGLGTPGQNLVVGDRAGRIGWTVYGSIPRRAGLDGRLPASWADGSRTWNGWLESSEYPRVVDPESGRIWTANARVVDGHMLALLGDGSYEIGSRARAIRERLASQTRFTPGDMLRIQLDARADFLARWRTLVLDTLTPAAVTSRPGRARFREVVEGTWDGQASPGSAAYRLTRMFREEVSARVIAFVLSECYEADPMFNYRAERRREGPIWKLATERPLHLLDPTYASWDELLLAAVDVVVGEVGQVGDLGEARWSAYNVTAYRHPLSAGLPFVGRLLDMPRHDLPGDLYTPRMQWGSSAASVRMVVSPGREADGIMHMPTGQSGHPLSPFYGNSHEAWASGEPTPLLPGPTAHTLTLSP